MDFEKSDPNPIQIRSDAIPTKFMNHEVITGVIG